LTLRLNSRRRLALYAILAAYVVLATIYSIVTPIFEASDELWHYPMVKYIADNGFQLPVQNPTVETAWRQEGSQPALYYLIAAALTSGIDTSDMNTLRRQNPHADIGVIHPDGNVNMIVHHTDLEAFPWRGTALAVHIARFFSVALGLGTIIVTYALARAVLPDYPVVALGAAALNAFLPMFLFISGSVNNDNLSNLLGNLLTLLIVLLLKAKALPTPRAYAVIGVVTGAGLLAKLNIGFLIPLVALALLVVCLRFRSWRPLVVGGLVSGGLTILIAGWWYLRNAQLYGDPTGLNVFLEIVGRRAPPANAAQLWAERHSFTQAFWGFFGGVNVMMPEPVYLIFNILGGLGILSAAAFLVYTLVKRRWTLDRWLPALVTILWSVITFISYLRWTSETPASQGRLVFGALSSILMWMALGFIWWLPRLARPLMMSAVAAFFGVVAVLVPFTAIAPAYDVTRTQPPELQESVGEFVLASFVEPDSGGMVDLMDASVGTDTMYPDDYAMVHLVWRLASPVSRDWSLFVHLVTPDGVIIGQRDIYPGNGLLAMTDLSEGEVWQADIAVDIPPTAYAPMALAVEVGWYHLPTGDRMTMTDGSEFYRVGTVELLPRQSRLGVPNPISMNFSHLIELVGYELSDLSPAAGDSVEVTLYWRGLDEIEQDYVVFAHVVDPLTTTLYAGSDAQPANWTAPTSTWQPGLIIEDRHTLAIDPATPPGIYELEIGLYLQTEDGFPRLRAVTPDGGMANDYLYLSRVRVLPNEDAS
jgi:4-amino-4-deoxy-L-arabinose transferase-like glycosyltransferase